MSPHSARCVKRGTGYNTGDPQAKLTHSWLHSPKLSVCKSMVEFPSDKLFPMATASLSRSFITSETPLDS